LEPRNRPCPNASGQADDAAVRVHAKSAALELPLELQLSPAGVLDCRVVSRIVADDDQIRDALITESRGDAARRFRLPFVVGLAADENDVADLNDLQVFNDSAASDERGGDVHRIRLCKRGEGHERRDDEAQQHSAAYHGFATP